MTGLACPSRQATGELIGKNLIGLGPRDHAFQIGIEAARFAPSLAFRGPLHPPLFFIGLFLLAQLFATPFLHKLLSRSGLPDA